MPRHLRRIFRRKRQILRPELIKQVQGEADGGIISYQKLNDKIYAIHTFLNTGSIRVYQTISAEIFMVGGGGGGGGRHGGGGGAGAVVHGNSYIEPGIYDITIGMGGKGGISDTWGNDGQATSFLNCAAIGGGGGGSYNGNVSTHIRRDGRHGGSGGGGGHTGGGGRKGRAIKYYVPFGVLYGNDGANGTSGAEGGGGGGAGSPGKYPVPGNGGDGILCPIDGYYYAGGGGGGGWGNLPGRGGLGGGGSGGYGASTSFIYSVIEKSRNLPKPSLAANSAGSPNGGHAGINTGSGGGGSGQRDNSNYTGIGGDGGSGILVLRYLIVNTVQTK